MSDPGEKADHTALVREQVGELAAELATLPRDEREYWLERLRVELQPIEEAERADTDSRVLRWLSEAMTREVRRDSERRARYRESSEPRTD